MTRAFLKNKIINCGWRFKFWDKANIFKIYLIYPDFKYWRQLFFLEKSFVKKEEKCFKILFESCIKCIVLCIFLSHNRPPLHDEILPIWRKTLSNQSINQSHNRSIITVSQDVNYDPTRSRGPCFTSKETVTKT